MGRIFSAYESIGSTTGNVLRNFNDGEITRTTTGDLEIVLHEFREGYRMITLD